jgi:hypothetical protein
METNSIPIRFLTVVPARGTLAVLLAGGVPVLLTPLLRCPSAVVSKSNEAMAKATNIRRWVEFVFIVVLFR